MKLEIINPSTQKTVEIYVVPHLSILDFQDWKDRSEVLLELNNLLDIVEKLDSKDLEAQTPIIPDPKDVDFYLPEPIKKHVFLQFKALQTDLELSREQFEDKVSTPALKLSTILTAVVKEILQNHYQRSDYKVRITDG